MFVFVCVKCGKQLHMTVREQRTTHACPRCRRRTTWVCYGRVANETRPTGKGRARSRAWWTD